MINRQDILNCIKNKDDRILFAKIIDKLLLCEKIHKRTFTEFLPFTKITEFLSYLKSTYIHQSICTFGGYQDAQRGIICFYPDYLEVSNKDFPINVLELSYDTRYSKNLNHRDFLGAMLGLGIERDKIGDIIVNNDSAIIFVEQNIASFIQFNIKKVGATKVKVDFLTLDDYTRFEQKYEEKTIIVPSLRLDSTLSNVFKVSRAKVSNFIKGEKVFVNFNIENSISKIIKTGDIISFRGFGKIKIGEVEKMTKKDRIVLKIMYYI